MLAPIAAVKGLYAYRPAMPIMPRPAPIFNTFYGAMMPRTKGRCDVRSIFLSYSISMYWLSACVDIDKAMDEANNGRQL